VVTNFGAKGDGIQDDTAAIRAAINSVASLGGGTVAFPAGSYRITGTLVIGDGNSTTRSTINAIKLSGVAGAGVGEGESGPPNYGVEILWDGATSPTTPMLQINGPIHSSEFEDLFFNCAGKAGIGVQARHLLKCKFRRVDVQQYTTLAWDLAVWDVPPIAGVTYGFFENLFEKITARDPRSGAFVTASANGISLQGGPVNNQGFSRNIFMGCEFAIGGNAGTYGIFGRYIDNNVFISCFTFWVAGATAGVGLKWVSDGNFPQENSFYHCPLIGGVTGAGVGTNLFLDYPLSDGEPLPAWSKSQHYLLPDGRLWGAFAGSAVFFTGSSDTVNGQLSTGGRYFSLSSLSQGAATDAPVSTVLPCGGQLSSFRVNLSVAPGGSSTRTFLVAKNGVATTATITFGPAESGDREVVMASPVVVYGGELLSVYSTVSGVPVNSDACWSAIFYPIEVR